MSGNTNGQATSLSRFSIQPVVDPNQLDSDRMSRELYNFGLLLYILTQKEERSDNLDYGEDVKIAYHFGDLMIRFNNSDTKEYAYIQAIRVNNVQDNLINNEVLLGKKQISQYNDDFDLQRHFSTYLRIKNQIKSRNDGSILKKFIIFTNAGLSDNIQKIMKNVETTENIDKIVPKIHKAASCCKINQTSDVIEKKEFSSLKDHLIKNLKSDLQILSEELAKYIINLNQAFLVMDTDCFCYYHSALVDENIIKILETKQNNKVMKYSFFTQEFIDNHHSLSDKAKKLREAVVEVTQRSGVRNIKEDMVKARLPVPEFGITKRPYEKIYLPSYHLTDESIQDFFNHLEFRVNEINIKDLFNKITSRNLEEKFSLYYDTENKLLGFLIADFIENWKSNEGFTTEGWILNSQKQQFIEGLNNNMSKPKAIQKTWEYTRELKRVLKQHNQHFNSITSFSENIFSSAKKIYYVNTKSTHICTPKLFNDLKRKNREDYIFVKLERFKKKEDMTDLIQTFRSEKFKFLILCYDVPLNFEMRQALLVNVNDVLQNNRKKIILITTVINDSLVGRLKNLYYNQNKYEEINVNDNINFDTIIMDNDYAASRRILDAYLNEQFVGEDKQLSPSIFEEFGPIIEGLWKTRFMNEQKGPYLFLIAADEGHSNIVKISLAIIEKNCSSMLEAFVSQQDDNSGMTALHLASGKGNSHVVGQFLTFFRHKYQGILRNCIKIQDTSGDTALHIASEKGHDKIVRQLLKPFENNLNELYELMKIQGSFKQTALHKASFKGHNEIVRILIKAFQNDPIKLRNFLKIQDLYLNTTLHQAIKSGSDQIVSQLLATFKNNIKELKDFLKIQDIYINTALHHAAKSGSDKIVSQLLATFKNNIQELKNFLKMKRRRQDTALHVASINGNDKVVALLLEPFQDNVYGLRDFISMPEMDDCTALHSACYNCNDKIIPQLLKPFINNEKELKNFLKKRNNDQDTALHIASLYGNDKMVSQLLAPFSNDVNEMKNYVKIKNYFNCTALHKASINGQDTIVAILLEPFKSDLIELKDLIKIPNKLTGTALHMAAKGNGDKVIGRLLEPFLNDTRELRDLIKICNNKNDTALHIACWMGHTKIVAQLMQYFKDDVEELKAFIKMKNSDGRTALHLACGFNGEKDDFEVDINETLVYAPHEINELLKYRYSYKDFKLFDEGKITNGNAEIVAQLLAPFQSNPMEMKDFINIQDHENATALTLACDSENENIVVQLLE